MAAGILVILTFAGAAAVAGHGSVGAPVAGPQTDATGAALGAPEPAAARDPALHAGSFTIGELAAGTVPQQVQDRSWQTQLDVILAAPCPTGPGRGAVAVTLYLGADEAWTARLRDAAAEHAAACDA